MVTPAGVVRTDDPVLSGEVAAPARIREHLVSQGMSAAMYSMWDQLNSTVWRREWALPLTVLVTFDEKYNF